ncbi:MAG: glycosyltransferase [Candidatus Sumerlaeota bacterium]|nr:glycosyltransferase [Candidatus Sumerlaeota bacterium]
MNVLQVHKRLTIEGGADIVMLETARLLKKRGHQVAFFGMRHPANEVTGQESYWVDYIDYHAPMSAWRKARLALKSVYSFEAASKMRRLLRDLPQDVAHLHNYHHQLTPAILGPLKAAGVPLVWTLHDFQMICPNYLLFDPHRLEVCEECKGGHYFSAARKRCLKGSLMQSLLASLEAHFHRLLNTYGRAIHCFVPPSRFLAEKIIAHGIPRDRVTQIPNPQSLDGCAPQDKDD